MVSNGAATYVIPAKAGISDREHMAGLHEVPASAWTTGNDSACATKFI